MSLFRLKPFNCRERQARILNSDSDTQFTDINKRYLGIFPYIYELSKEE